MADIRDIIRQAAARYGVPVDYMQRMAQIESGYNPNARNPSGAAGLYQFMPGTARDYNLSNPYDPAASADAAARLTLDNKRHLSNVLGREPSSGELYLAHQQGAGGASKLLTNPDAAASSLVGQAAVTQNGGQSNWSARQFADKWTGKFADGAREIGDKISSATNNFGGLLAPKEQGAFYQDKIQGPQQPTAGMTGGGGGLLAGGFGLNGPQAQDTPMTINQGQNSSLPSFARPDAPLFDMKGLTPTGGGGGLGGALGGLSAIASALGGGGGGDSKASLPQLPTPAPMPAHTPKTEGVQAMSAQRRNEAFSLLAPRRRGRDPLSLLG